MYVSHITSLFTSEQLMGLQQAHGSACDELNLDFSEADAFKRARVAAVIIQMALHGELDPDVLKKCAVLRYYAEDRDNLTRH